MADDKITQIEETLAHHEQQVSDLNDVVINQSQDIAALKKLIRRLQDKIEVIENGDGSEDESSISVTEQAKRDKPPHY